MSGSKPESRGRMKPRNSSRCPECSEIGQFKEMRDMETSDARIWECTDCDTEWRRP